MTLLLYDLGRYVHKPDVQNKWDDNTHTQKKGHKRKGWSSSCQPRESRETRKQGGGAQGTQGSSKNCTSRERVSPLSRLIRGFRDEYH